MNREEILKNLLLIGDRAVFIEELLRMESSEKLRLEADTDEECTICREMYSSPTSIEYKIQLPCCGKHTMGSECIEAWLRKHNTCPLCRQEFFPERGYKIDEDDFLIFEFENEAEDDDDRLMTEDDYESLLLELAHVRRFCHHICHELGLYAPGDLVMHIATEVAVRMCYLGVVLNLRTVDYLNEAAACVYMASHLTCQPLTMDEIARGCERGSGFAWTQAEIASGYQTGSAFPLTEANIANVYQYLDEAAHDIMDQDMCQLLGTDDLAQIMLRLPTSQRARRPVTLRLPMSQRTREYVAVRSAIREYDASHPLNQVREY